MGANKIVADKSNKIRRSNFNMSYDANATVSFGEVFPVLAQFLHQPSHSHLKIDHVARMFPLINPTFGRCSVKFDYNFVGLSEVFPCWKNVLGNKLSTLRSTKNVSDLQITHWDQSVINCFPRITPHSLLFILSNIKELCERVPAVTSWSGSQPSTLKYKQTSASDEERLGGWNSVWTPSSRYSRFTSIEPDKLVLTNSGYGMAFTPRDADVKIFGSSSKTSSWLALIRWTSKGRRIVKILEGLGYNINFKDKKSKMSLLPLLAWYRCYFINHMIPLSNYVDWEDTACYKLIESFSHDYSSTNDGGNFDLDITSSTGGTLSDIERMRIDLLFEFFRDELSVCVWTDDTLESACLSGTMTDRRIEKNPFFSLRSYRTSDDIDTQYVEDAQLLNTPVGVNGDLWAGSIEPDSPSAFPYGLSHLNIEALKQLYLYVNRGTLNGSRVEKELIARGYADYVKDCHVHSLGSFSDVINITEITSTSDTFSSDELGNYSGRTLAEPAGRGVGGAEGSYIDFDNDEPGFLFCSVSIVPFTKGIENLDMSLLMTDMETYYAPEFDGLGYEALPNSYLSIVDDFVDTHSGDNENPSGVFGILPRFSSIKTRKNKAIGGFHNYNGLLSYGGYTLDSIILRNVANSRPNEGSEHCVEIDYTLGVGPNNGSDSVTEYLVPQAGRYWYQTLLSSWFGNLDRIFNELSFRYFESKTRTPSDPLGLAQFSEISYLKDSGYKDTFMLHCAVDYTLTTRMLPLSQSWGCSSADPGDKIKL